MNLAKLAGSVWYDVAGRELTVHGVYPGDRLGREIQGRLIDEHGEEHDYATDQRTFQAIWANRAPRAVFRT